MSQFNARAIITWLESKLGNDYNPENNPMWIEHGYAFGCTESGFSSAHTIDYEALEREMDKWIAETFGKPTAPPNPIFSSSSARFNAFKTALEDLCRLHRIQISTSQHDGLQAWHLDDGDAPIYSAGFENCISK